MIAGIVPKAIVKDASTFRSISGIGELDYLVVDAREETEAADEPRDVSLKRLDPKYVSYLLTTRPSPRMGIFEVCEMVSYVGRVRFEQPECVDVQASASLRDPLAEWRSVLQAVAQSATQADAIVAKAVEDQLGDLEALIVALTEENKALLRENADLRLEVMQLQALVEGLRAASGTKGHRRWQLVVSWVAAIGGVLSGIGGTLQAVESAEASREAIAAYAECLNTNRDLQSLLERVVKIENPSDLPTTPAGQLPPKGQVG